MWVQIARATIARRSCRTALLFPTISQRLWRSFSVIATPRSAVVDRYATGEFKTIRCNDYEHTKTCAAGDECLHLHRGALQANEASVHIIRDGLNREGARVISHMYELNPEQYKALNPDAVVVVLKSATALRHIELPRTLYKMKLLSRKQLSLYLRCLLSCRQLQEAQTLYESLDKPTVYDTGAMIRAHANFGQLSEARVLFKTLKKPSPFLCTTMLKAFFKAGDIEAAELLYKRHRDANEAIRVEMISGYGRTKDTLRLAERVFWSLTSPGVGAQNTLLKVYMSHGQITKAEKLFMAMRSPDVYTFTTLLRGYVADGHLERAEAVYETLSEPSEEASCILLKGYCDEGRLLEAQALYDTLAVPGRMTCHTLMKGYITAGDVEKAYALAKSLQNPNHTTEELLRAAAARDPAPAK